MRKIAGSLGIILLAWFVAYAAFSWREARQDGRAISELAPP